MNIIKINPLLLSKKFARLIVIFSPIFEIRLIKLSFTVEPFFILVKFNFSKFPLFEKFKSDSSLQK